MDLRQMTEEEMGIGNRTELRQMMEEEKQKFEKMGASEYIYNIIINEEIYGSLSHEEIKGILSCKKRMSELEGKEIAKPALLKIAGTLGTCYRLIEQRKKN